MDHPDQEEGWIIPQPSLTTASSSNNTRYYNNTRYRWRRGAVRERISRALSHPLLLLHRLDPRFFVLGSTGNVYIVTIAFTPCCTCPDPTTPCKHILFILLRVLTTTPPHNPAAITSSTILYPKRLSRLLATPTSPDSLAGETLRWAFLRLFFQERMSVTPEKGDGIPCPICLDKMLDGEEPMLVCHKCRNGVHRKCMTMWRRKGANQCVMCRAEWRGRMQLQSYINLAAHTDTSTSAHDSHLGLTKRPLKPLFSKILKKIVVRIMQKRIISGHIIGDFGSLKISPQFICQHAVCA